METLWGSKWAEELGPVLVGVTRYSSLGRSARRRARNAILMTGDDLRDVRGRPGMMASVMKIRRKSRG